MSTELLKILYAVGIGQSVILAIILLLPRSSSRLARRGLALFLIVMGLMLWDSYASLLGPEFIHWRLGSVVLAIVALYGPSIWIYVCGLTRGDLRL